MHNSSWMRSKTISTAGILIISFIFIGSFSSCARKTYFPSGSAQTGLASWYGEEFHGKPTSCKEIYDMYEMTAAHRTLPFHSHVEVTNLSNGKKAVVRINDRGPFVEGRIIDLSYAAAQSLDMVEDGVVPVRLRIIESKSPKKSSQHYFVLAGSFVMIENAKKLSRRLRSRYSNVEIAVFHLDGQDFHRVKIRAKNLEQAEEIAADLRSEEIPALVIEEYRSKK